MVLIGSAGAVVIWFIRLGLPESPRWLARHGRLAEAEAITAAIEAEVAAEAGPLPAPGAAEASEEAGDGSFAEIWQPPYDRRAIVLSVFNFFQTFGYYGFAAWVPTLLIAKGITITTSLLYSFIIAIANPVGPLLGTLVADRMERKWQVCCGAIGIAVFGLLFASASTGPMLIVLGVLLTLSNNWMSYSFHGYQSELFPTRIRSRAVGFVYSWSRLSAALSGLAVALSAEPGRRDCGVQLHRILDADRGDLDRRLRTAHTRPGAGGDLQRLAVHRRMTRKEPACRTSQRQRQPPAAIHWSTR